MNLLQHLHSRHMNTDLHPCILVEEEGYAAFPLWDLSGNLCGFQQYRPQGDKKIHNDFMGKYFTRQHFPHVAMWELESWNLSNTLFVTEGIFDAARITSRGYSALAAFSNTLDKNRTNWLYMVNQFRPVVAICDSDIAGKLMTKYIKNYVVVEGAKDLGDSTDNYVTELLKPYS